jgi:hypothetical protein
MYETQVNVNLQTLYVNTTSYRHMVGWMEVAPRMNLGTGYEVRGQIRAPATLTLLTWELWSGVSLCVVERKYLVAFPRIDP